MATRREIEKLVAEKIAGQHSQVDVGSAMPKIVTGMLDLIEEGAGGTFAVKVSYEPIEEEEGRVVYPVLTSQEDLDAFIESAKSDTVNLIVVMESEKMKGSISLRPSAFQLNDEKDEARAQCTLEDVAFTLNLYHSKTGNQSTLVAESESGTVNPELQVVFGSTPVEEDTGRVAVYDILTPVEEIAEYLEHFVGNPAQAIIKLIDDTWTFAAKMTVFEVSENEMVARAEANNHRYTLYLYPNKTSQVAVMDTSVQVDVLPAPSRGYYLDRSIFQWIGEDSEDFHTGYFYKCVETVDETTGETTYKWSEAGTGASVNVDNFTIVKNAENQISAVYGGGKTTTKVSGIFLARKDKSVYCVPPAESGLPDYAIVFDKPKFDLVKGSSIDGFFMIKNKAEGEGSTEYYILFKGNMGDIVIDGKTYLGIRDYHGSPNIGIYDRTRKVFVITNSSFDATASGWVEETESRGGIRATGENIDTFPIEPEFVPVSSREKNAIQLDNEGLYVYEVLPDEKTIIYDENGLMTTAAGGYKEEGFFDIDYVDNQDGVYSEDLTKITTLPAFILASLAEMKQGDTISCSVDITMKDGQVQSFSKEKVEVRRLVFNELKTYGIALGSSASGYDVYLADVPSQGVGILSASLDAESQVHISSAKLTRYGTMVHPIYPEFIPISSKERNAIKVGPDGLYVPVTEGMSIDYKTIILDEDGNASSAAGGYYEERALSLVMSGEQEGTFEGARFAFPVENQMTNGDTINYSVDVVIDGKAETFKGITTVPEGAVEFVIDEERGIRCEMVDEQYSGLIWPNISASDSARIHSIDITRGEDVIVPIKPDFVPLSEDEHNAMMREEDGVSVPFDNSAVVKDAEGRITTRVGGGLTGKTIENELFPEQTPSKISLPGASFPAFLIEKTAVRLRKSDLITYNITLRMDGADLNYTASDVAMRWWTPDEIPACWGVELLGSPIGEWPVHLLQYDSELILYCPGFTDAVTAVSANATYKRVGMVPSDPSFVALDEESVTLTDEDAKIGVNVSVDKLNALKKLGRKGLAVLLSENDDNILALIDGRISALIDKQTILRDSEGRAKSAIGGYKEDTYAEVKYVDNQDGVYSEEITTLTATPSFVVNKRDTMKDGDTFSYQMEITLQDGQSIQFVDAGVALQEVHLGEFTGKGIRLVQEISTYPVYLVDIPDVGLAVCCYALNVECQVHVTAAYLTRFMTVYHPIDHRYIPVKDTSDNILQNTEDGLYVPESASDLKAGDGIQIVNEHIKANVGGNLIEKSVKHIFDARAMSESITANEVTFSGAELINRPAIGDFINVVLLQDDNVRIDKTGIEVTDTSSMTIDFAGASGISTIVLNFDTPSQCKVTGGPFRPAGSEFRLYVKSYIETPGELHREEIMQEWLPIDRNFLVPQGTGGIMRDVTISQKYFAYIFDLLYPVGSVYLSTSESTEKPISFRGNWESVSNPFGESSPIKTLWKRV